MIKKNDLDRVKQEITTQGWSIVKNTKTIEMAMLARQEYFSTFEKVPLTSGGFTYEALQLQLIRKKNISSSNGLGEPYAQVLQSMYYPVKNRCEYMERIFQALIVTRNQLTNKADDYGDNPREDRFWNARRVHHYPRGGGFMMGHRDTYFPKVLGEMNFLQSLFLISEPGVDFQSGGGFIFETDGRTVDIDQDKIGGMGAVFFFDGRIVHGVKDIDPNERFDFDARTGRLSVVANLYEYRS